MFTSHMEQVPEPEPELAHHVHGYHGRMYPLARTSEAWPRIVWQKFQLQSKPLDNLLTLQHPAHATPPSR